MADVAMTWVDSTSHFFLLLQTVALWDLRNLKMKLHSFESHKDEIFQVCVCVCVQHVLNGMSDVPLWGGSGGVSPAKNTVKGF